MRTIPLALFGLGTVGKEVARLLGEHRDLFRARLGDDLALKWVVVRDPQKQRPPHLGDARVITDPTPVYEDREVEIAIEVMGTVEPALAAVTKLLASGKHVVTANKALLAERGNEVFRVAHQHRRAVRFEASVAGGIPILAAVGESLAADRIIALAGIVNGTSNYILTAMHERGLDYATALAQAQARGFAEADPTLDVDGSDAAQKLAILSRLAFHSAVDPNKVRRRGIDGVDPADIRFAHELGYVIKLLAVSQVEGNDLHLRVGPTLVPERHPMALVRGEYNAVQVVGMATGDTFYCGKGAGGAPTASSVLAGVLDLATGRGQQSFASLQLWDERPPGPRFVPDAFLHSRFYFRFTISDRPGVLAQIAGVLGRYGISISSVIQHDTTELAADNGEAAVPLLIMTHRAAEGAVWTALAEVDGLPIVRKPTVCLHVTE